MKCLNCNHNIKKDDNFCENCGSKISKNNSISIIEKIKNKITNLSKKLKITFCIIVFLIIVLGSGIKIINYFNSPSYLATSYFKAIIANDSKEVFKYLNTTASTFVTENLLNEKLENLGAVSEYKLQSIQVSKNNAVATFVYTLENSSYQYISNVSLSKKINKQYFIFDKWQINSAQLVTNVLIKVPKNSTLTLDSIELDNYKIDSEYDSFDSYKIPAMIKGDYLLKTTLENGIEVEDTISVSNNTTYYLSNIDLNENLNTSIKSTATNTINNLYQSALENKTFDEIESSLTYENADLNDLKNNYNKLKNNIKISKLVLNSINFTNIDITNSSYDSNGLLQVSIDLNYYYTSSYTTSAETISYSDTDCSTKMVLILEYINGEYKIKNINGLYVNYPVKK